MTIDSPREAVRPNNEATRVRPTRLASSILILLVLISAGCGPSPEDVVELYRDRAEQRLSLLASLIERAAATDDPDALVGASAETGIAAPVEGLEIEGSVPDSLSAMESTLPDRLRFHGPGCNAALIHLEVLDTDPSTRPPLDLIIPTDWLTWVREGLDQRPIPNAELLESSFEQLLHVKYFAILRTKYYSEPVELYDDQFASGSWEAELLLFQLDDGKQIAVLPLEASNEREVRVREDDVAAWLRSDLWTRARESVRIACDPLCAEGTRAIP